LCLDFWESGELSVDDAVVDVAGELAGEGDVLEEVDAVFGCVEWLVDGVEHDDGVHGFQGEVVVWQQGQGESDDGGVGFRAAEGCCACERCHREDEDCG